jgi:hypothetical protein
MLPFEQQQLLLEEESYLHKEAGIKTQSKK